MSYWNHAIFAESDEGGDDDEEEINVHDLEEHAANGGKFINKKNSVQFFKITYLQIYFKIIYYFSKLFIYFEFFKEWLTILECAKELLAN